MLFVHSYNYSLSVRSSRSFSIVFITTGLVTFDGDVLCFFIYFCLCTGTYVSEVVCSCLCLFD